MKNISLLTVMLFIASFSFGQQNTDTLIVPVGKYQFIKIGDKIYKINYLLEEVPPALPKWGGIKQIWPGNITPASMYPIISDSTITRREVLYINY